MAFQAIPSLSITSFDYNLPDSAVAKYPLPERDQSKLLVWKENNITDTRFSDLPGWLPEKSMLVFNNTRVIRARLNFAKPTGAKIEVFCLEPTHPGDYVLSFAQTISCRWKCLVGNLKRWKEEVLQLQVEVQGQSVILNAEKLGELEGGFEIRFSWEDPRFTFSELLEAAGNMPIPPYLHRESEEIDLTVYQTVYSKIKGSVAAPTAGLHFTARVLRELADRAIDCEELTLHVGAGTFQPVKSETIGEHRMHTEHFLVSKTLIDRLATHPGKVIAVGTTSVRTLESLYWIGCKILLNPQITHDQLLVEQWEPYEDKTPEFGTKEALQAILAWMVRNSCEMLDTATRIIIVPGYRFRIISGLVTNFHQPQSTLLLLIAAILGDEWKKVYAHALDSGYRFLSYGDANLYLM